MIIYYISFLFLVVFFATSILTLFFLMRRGIRLKRFNKFKDNLNQIILASLLLEETTSETLAKEIRPFFENNFDYTTRILIDYLRLIKGKEHSIIADCIIHLGLTRMILNEYNYVSLNKKIKYITWLLHVNRKSYQPIFQTLLSDSDQLVRVVGALGLSQITDKDILSYSIKLIHKDLEETFGVSCVIMSNFGSRFGSDHLISFIHEIKDLYPNLAKAGLMALIETDKTNSLDIINSLFEELNMTKDKYLFEIDKKLKLSNNIIGI